MRVNKTLIYVKYLTQTQENVTHLSWCDHYCKPIYMYLLQSYSLTCLNRTSWGPPFCLMYSQMFIYTG